tara:strand:+ start:432 stop:764 length:333 start_codon:yes stop_codon:yes gene_type:complete
MEKDDYHALQREQNERIKALETRISNLDNFLTNDNERIRKLEKWVWGAGAIVTAVIGAFGFIEITDFGFQTTNKQVKEHREFLTETVVPAFERDNWLGKEFKGKPNWAKE